MFKRYVLSGLTIIAAVHMYGAQIEHLVPPIINETTITKIWCDRPRRTDGIATSVENIQGKTVVNCYGHGGSGYVALFGSVYEAINNFMALKPELSTPIRIIGSGVVGLTMAVELHQRGFTHISISTKQMFDIPSWRAGGFFDPGTGKETTYRAKQLLKLGLASYPTYFAISQGKHPYLTENIVQCLPLYCRQGVDAGVEVLAELGHMPPAQPVTLDFGNGVQHENFIKYHTYFINTTQVMKQLWNEVRRRNISVTVEEITQLSDCQEPVICNCAGIASGMFNGDTTLAPSRGHFFMLNVHAGQKHMDYMIFTEVQQNNKMEYLCFFPKNSFVTPENPEGIHYHGMLGGTFFTQINKLNAEEQAALAQQEYTKLLQRSQTFFYGTTDTITA